MPKLTTVCSQHGVVGVLLPVVSIILLFCACADGVKRQQSRANDAHLDAREQFILSSLRTGLSREILENTLGSGSPARHGGWVYEEQPALTTIIWYAQDDSVCRIWLILGSGQVLETRDDPAVPCPGANGS